MFKSVGKSNKIRINLSNLNVVERIIMRFLRLRHRDTLYGLSIQVHQYIFIIIITYLNLSPGINIYIFLIPTRGPNLVDRNNRTKSIYL